MPLRLLLLPWFLDLFASIHPQTCAISAEVRGKSLWLLGATVVDAFLVGDGRRWLHRSHNRVDRRRPRGAVDPACCEFFAWYAPWLYYALSRMKETHVLTAGKLLDVIRECEFFKPERKPLLVVLISALRIQK